MDLIIGGTYQGKLDYAKEQFHLKNEDIYTCTANEDADVSRRCLNRVQEIVLRALRMGRTPEFAFRPDAVLLCDDIFCGVVPTDDETRAWREQTGRLLGELARRADTVTRVFCGIAQKLK
jgi:adenosylcobinamide kinase/adenosylcobinamide-phosphate guanylyltransferase